MILLLKSSKARLLDQANEPPSDRPTDRAPACPVVRSSSCKQQTGLNFSQGLSSIRTEGVGDACFRNQDVRNVDYEFQMPRVLLRVRRWERHEVRTQSHRGFHLNHTSHRWGSSRLVSEHQLNVDEEVQRPTERASERTNDECSRNSGPGSAGN